MVNRIYSSELQLNKANVSDTETSFLDLHLFISDGFAKTKIYDKRDDFDIVNFPSLDGDVPRSTSYSVYISHNITYLLFTVINEDMIQNYISSATAKQF